MHQPSNEPPTRDLRQRDLVPPARLAECQASVIGVGAIGRQVALQLAAIGVPRLHLIDPDTVETVNLGPQGYRAADVGQTKVSATGELCRQLNPDIEIESIPDRFRRSGTLGNAVFCCVDSIDTRRLIWQAVGETTDFWADGRMNAEVIRVLAAADVDSRAHYPATLFTQQQAHQGACTARSTIYTANIAAGLMVGQFARWLRGQAVHADVLLNLAAAEFVDMAAA